MDDRNTNDAHEFERLKLAVDSVKHITTLATGTIVLLVTLVERIPKPVADKADLHLALISLLICIAASVGFLYGMTVARYGPVYPGHDEGRERIKEAMLKMEVEVIYFSFSLGITFLGAFAWQNI
jgi:hypothetical protein